MQASFGAGISQPAAVRGSTHPADWQNSSLIIVHLQGRTPALTFFGPDCIMTFAVSHRRSRQLRPRPTWACSLLVACDTVPYLA